jgi:uncharacterized membrane protein YgcG
VRGYLRIEEVPESPSPDWWLVPLDKAGGLLDYEQILLDGLFMGPAAAYRKTSTQLSDLGPDFAGQLKRAQDALYADVAERGWFTARPDRVRRRWLTAGVALFAVGAAALAAAVARSHLGLIPVPVALAGLVLIGCARWMPARTARGTDLARRLAGFRRYITTAAAGPPGPAQRYDVLYDYLPYAIAFGCTREWAEVTASLEEVDRPPSWYRSSRPSHHFWSFATAASSGVASSASASGTSGFSGGGGYSGGGGGGGGGGSW